MQTPFLNGREFTIFHGNDSYSGGIAGVAFVDKDSSSETTPSSQVKVKFPTLIPISETVEISR